MIKSGILGFSFRGSLKGDKTYYWTRTCKNHQRCGRKITKKGLIAKKKTRDGDQRVVPKATPCEVTSRTKRQRQFQKKREGRGGRGKNHYLETISGWISRSKLRFEGVFTAKRKVEGER